MPWNGYPHYIRTKIFNQFQSKQKGQRNNNDQDKENLTTIFCRIPHVGAHGDSLL